MSKELAGHNSHFWQKCQGDHVSQQGARKESFVAMNNFVPAKRKTAGRIYSVRVSSQQDPSQSSEFGIRRYNDRATVLGIMNCECVDD